MQPLIEMNEREPYPSKAPGYIEAGSQTDARSGCFLSAGLSFPSFFMNNLSGPSRLRQMSPVSLRTWPALVTLFLLAVSAGTSSPAAESEISWRKVRDDGLVATLFLPADPTPRTGVIVLGGSEGGLRAAEWLAQQFAKEGWPTLAVAYFGTEHLPPYLASIPLEYFDRSVAWMSAQPFVQSGSITLVGSSRGAEIALLVAAHNPAVNRVIAFAPSSVLWGPLVPQPQAGLPAWTRTGRPLPFVTMRPTLTPPDQPYRGTPDFNTALQDKAAVEAAGIPVERIQGAVLLLSGTDDQVWPSTSMAAAIISRLESHGHKYPFEHVSFRGAGHVLVPGMDPGLVEIKHPMGFMLALGGTAEANREAQRKAWAKATEFLKSRPRRDKE